MISVSTHLFDEWHRINTLWATPMTWVIPTEHRGIVLKQLIGHHHGDAEGKKSNIGDCWNKSSMVFGYLGSWNTRKTHFRCRFSTFFFWEMIYLVLQDLAGFHPSWTLITFFSDSPESEADQSPEAAWNSTRLDIGATEVGFLWYAKRISPWAATWSGADVDRSKTVV